MFFPISRIIALLMAGVLCAMLATMALARHIAALAIFIVAVFLAYLAGNIVLWQRMRRGD
jgi:membrane protein DedA with SNARE-associated domain